MCRCRIIFHKCVVFLLEHLVRILEMERFRLRILCGEFEASVQSVELHFKKTDILAEIACKADRVMVEKRLYLLPELTLEMLAREVNSNRTYLSKAIHLWRGMGFREYVNQYRLRYARDLYMGGASAPIDLAIMSGFNDVRTFNKTRNKIKDNIFK